MRLRYTTRAITELEGAIDWYEAQQPGLGIRFLDNVESAVVSILENPRRFPKTHDAYRRSLVRRFPFSIHFSIEEDLVIVHAIFDNRRSPKELP